MTDMYRTMLQSMEKNGIEVLQICLYLLKVTGHEDVLLQQIRTQNLLVSRSLLGPLKQSHIVRF